MARAKNQHNGQIEEAIKRLLQTQEAIQQNQQNQATLQAAIQQNHAALQQQIATQQQQIATLVQTQAAFVARMSETDARIADMDRRMERRFSHIEAILTELLRMMERLPEAVREKIGFKSKGPQAGESS